MFNRSKYYNKFYSVDVSILPQDSDILDIPTPVNVEENELLFPQDPSTGQLVDLLSQVLETDNPLLRDSLMSKLETLPSNSSSLANVDDETKIHLLKPRSCQSLSELADFTKYVESAIEQLNIDPNQVENVVEDVENQEHQDENSVTVSE